MRVEQGVILVGGLGSRFGALAQNVPKPMLEVAGRPFVEHAMSHLARFGVREILLLAVHRGRLVHDRYDGEQLFGARLSVLVEPEPRGTAGALTFAAERLHDVFLLCNGDTFFDADLLPLIAFAEDPCCAAALLLRKSEGDTGRYGHVGLDANGVIGNFAEKPHEGGAGPVLLNAGAYLIRRRPVLAAIGEAPCSLEEVFPRLAQAGALRGAIGSGYFVDIGIPQSLAAARTELGRRRTRPAAFLDRDGVLNVDLGYTHRADQLVWTEQAPQAVRALNRAGYYVFVVTNQAGIARGYYDRHAVERLHAHMQDVLIAHGAHIDAFYHCPHHPDGVIAELAVRCRCRKPGPGLLEQAAAEWFIDRDNSFLIGNSDSDMAAAAAFDIPGIRFDAAQKSLFDLVTQELAGREQTRAAEKAAS